MKIVYEHLAASVHELKKQPEQQELDIDQTSDTEEKAESEENTE